jgi:hypothetical protein
MKKVFYSIAIVSAMMFASCTEDRGRTYETADANQDESVNRSHIRGNETAMGAGTGTDMTTGSDATWRTNSERISGQMATDMQLDDQTRSRVQQTLYERERRLSELEGQYNFNETNRMGGQVAEDVDNTATSERDRIDRDGGTMTDTRGNMNMSTTTDAGNTELTEMEAERRLIMTDTDRELESILTPEQYRQYQEKRAIYWGTTEGTNQMDNDGTMQNSGQDQLNNNQMNNNQNNNQLNNTQDRTNQPRSNTNSGNNRNGN